MQYLATLTLYALAIITAVVMALWNGSAPLAAAYGLLACLLIRLSHQLDTVIEILDEANPTPATEESSVVDNEKHEKHEKS